MNQGQIAMHFEEIKQAAHMILQHAEQAASALPSGQYHMAVKIRSQIGAITAMVDELTMELGKVDSRRTNNRE